jgi:hypothetical protein
VQRPPWQREIVLGLALFGVYIFVDALGGADRLVTAKAHAADLLALERSLHLDVELAANHWLAPHDVLRILANYEYAFSYLISAFALILWVYWRRPWHWRIVRDSFAALNLVSMLCFVVYPVAPPRFLADSGFIDTVQTGHTLGSWGWALTDQANQLAAMPSLHVGWALWVSVMLGVVVAPRWIQLVSAVHVAVTVAVIVSTANHFVLDAVGGFVVVWVAVLLARGGARFVDSRRTVVPSADAFFWHLNTPQAPQIVAGLAYFEPTTPSLGKGPAPDLDDVRRAVALHLARLPRFRQHLAVGSRWRRLRWVDAEEVDLSWHVVEHDLRGPDGRAAPHDVVQDYVNAMTTTPLPDDRPLWRLIVVRGVAPGQSALLVMAHHTFSDGLGVIENIRQLLTPPPGPPPVAPDAPGPWRRAAATAYGLAQLATDGRATVTLSDPAASARRFAGAPIDLSLLRDAARRQGCRITDVVLAATAEALATTHPELAQRARWRLRVAVPMMLRAPGSTDEGNVTAAVMIDLPLEPMAPSRRVALIRERTARLRTPTRALGSRFVMSRVLGILPEPAVAWFARTVYGRRFFQAIVSNVPGPVDRVALAGSAVTGVLPVLPLAPGAPLTVGTLGWPGVVGVGMVGDPEVIDVDQLVKSFVQAVESLRDEPGQESWGAPQTTARNSRERSVGSSSAAPKDSRSWPRR